MLSEVIGLPAQVEVDGAECAKDLFPYHGPDGFEVCGGESHGGGSGEWWCNH